MLIILLASSLHSSAIVGILAFFVANRKITKKLGGILVISMLAVIPFLRFLVPALTSVMFVGRYQNFQDEGGAYTMFVIYTLLYVISIRKESDDQRFNFIKWMVLLSALSQSLGVISTSSMTRIGYYFTFYLTIFFSEYQNRYIQPKLQTIVKNAIAIAMFVFCQLTASGGSMGVIPYKFFWETPLYIY